MQIPEELSGGGIGGWIGAIAATVVGGGLFLRRWLSKDAVERAGDEAQKEVIDMLTAQLAAALARADTLTKELRLAYESIADLREKVARLETRMQIWEQEKARAQPNT